MVRWRLGKNLSDFEYKGTISDFVSSLYAWYAIFSPPRSAMFSPFLREILFRKRDPLRYLGVDPVHAEVVQLLQGEVVVLVNDLPAF